VRGGLDLLRRLGEMGRQMAHLLTCLTTIAAFQVGRRQPALLRVLLLLAMFPACKKDDRRRDQGATRGDKAVISDDAAVISALVTAEHVLTLSQR
jgi:hypothetical protein